MNLSIAPVAGSSSSLIEDTETDNSDNIYAFDYNSKEVYKFSATGSFVTSWTPVSTGVYDPMGIGIDRVNGYVFTTGISSAGLILTRSTLTGGSIGQWTDDPGFYINVTVDSNGNYFTTNGTKIAKYRNDGLILTAWSVNTPGSVSELETDSANRVYAFDGTTVYVYDDNGNYLCQYTPTIGSGSLADFTVDNAGDLYLLVSDGNNSRVLIYDPCSSGTSTSTPTISNTSTTTNTATTTNSPNATCTLTTGESASFEVGEPDFVTANTSPISAKTLSDPRGLFLAGNKMVVSDTQNNRILIYSPAPTSNDPPAVQVLGQTSFATGSANQGGAVNNNTLDLPMGIWTDGTMMIVSDLANNRVLIYNNIGSLPAVNGTASMVIGQLNMTSSTALPVNNNTLGGPEGVFYDGHRLFISDTGNNRVLVYNSIPTYFGAPADEVIGQPNFTSNGPNQGPTYPISSPTQFTLNGPVGLWVDNGNLYVSDTSNNRILVYPNADTFTGYDPAAISVIGQSSFTSNTYNGANSSVPNNTSFFEPQGLSISNGQLFVSDWGNSRVVVYDNIPTGTSNTPASAVLGQANFNSRLEIPPTTNTISLTGDVKVYNGTIYAIDQNDNRILAFNCGPASGSPTPTATATSTFSQTVTQTPSPTSTITSGDTATASFTSTYSTTATVSCTPNIFTVAGNGIAGSTGNGGPATAAEIYYPSGVAADALGNVYWSDELQVRKVNLVSGIVTTAAGTGVGGFAGIPGPATSANVGRPVGVAVDSSNNLYLASLEYVLKVTYPAGTISIVAGNGSAGYNGDGIPATSAEIQTMAVAVDAAGNLYLADFGNHRIRKVNVGTGMISTIAGTGTAGYNGDGIPATSAELNFPTGVAVDGSNNLYISDLVNDRVRRVNLVSGLITTVAGNGSTAYSGDGSIATSSGLQPVGVGVDGSGNILVADNANNRVFKINPASDIITTVAGTAGGAGYNGDGIPATSAKLGPAYAVAVDPSGNLFIADQGNNRVREVACNQVVIFTPTSTPSSTTTTTNTPVSTSTTTATLTASFTTTNTPAPISTNCVQTMDQYASLVVGEPDFTSANNSSVPVNSSLLLGPVGVFQTGNSLFVDDQYRVLIYTPNPTTNGPSANKVIGQPNFTTGTVESYTFNNVTGDGLGQIADLWTDGIRLVVADHLNSRVLIYNNVGALPVVGGFASVVIGQSLMTTGAPNQGGAIGANTLSDPFGVYFDGQRLFVADRVNNRVLIYNSLPTSNNASADEVIGQSNFTSGSPNQGGTVGANTLDDPRGLWVYNGTLFVADSQNNRVLGFNNGGLGIDSITPGTTNLAADMVIGQGNYTSSASGTSNNGMFHPSSVSADNGRLYVSDLYNNRVLVYNSIPTGTANPAANFVLGQQTFSGNQINQGLSTPQAYTLYWPEQIQAVNGVVYVADSGNSRVLVFNCDNNTPTMTPTLTQTPTLTPTQTATSTMTTTATQNATICLAYSTTFGTPGAQPGQFRGPLGIAVDTSGLVDVIDTGNSRVQQFNPSGSLFSLFGSSGTALGQFTAPLGTGAGAGYIFVTDHNATGLRIQRFSNSGGSPISFPIQQVGDPVGFSAAPFIAVDNAGTVYVITSQGIRRFNSNGTVVTPDVSIPTSGSNGFIAVDNSGHVYLAEGNQIVSYTITGSSFATYLPPITVTTPGAVLQGLSVDPSGFIYVVDSANKEVDVFNPSGSSVATLGPITAPGQQFSSPFGVTVDSIGAVYVTDQGNGNVVKFQPCDVATQTPIPTNTLNFTTTPCITPVFISAWGSPGTNPGQFYADYPEYIAAGTNGDVYVASSTNGPNGIQRFTDSGSYLNSMVPYGGNYGMTSLSNGDLLVYSASPNSVCRYSPAGGSPTSCWPTVPVSGTLSSIASDPTDKIFIATGNVVNWYSVMGSPLGSFTASNVPASYPIQRLAIDSLGDVYVSYQTGVQEYSAAGAFIRQITSAVGPSTSQTSGITVDAMNDLYVADAGNNRIEEFNPSGSLLVSWGTMGAGYGQFNQPDAITVSGNFIYVADAINGRVEVFETCPHTLATATPTQTMTNTLTFTPTSTQTTTPMIVNTSTATLTNTATITPAICNLSCVNEGAVWSRNLSSGPFGGRNNAALVTFMNQMWLIGGEGTGVTYDDIWTSNDGVNWNHNSFSFPTGDTVISAYVDPNIGGSNGTLYVVLNTSSGAVLEQTSNGTTWASSNFPIGFSANQLFDLGGTLYAVGGNASSLTTEYESTNAGATWSLVTASNLPAIPESAFFSAYSINVYNGSVWLIGGENAGGGPSSYIYKSSDGVHWILATPAPAYGNKANQSVLNYDGKMWLMSGNYGTGSDVWYTCDGVNWYSATQNGGFPPRGFQAATVFDGRMWIIGGMPWVVTGPIGTTGLLDGYFTNPLLSDVWSSVLCGTPTATSTLTATYTISSTDTPTLTPTLTNTLTPTNTLTATVTPATSCTFADFASANLVVGQNLFTTTATTPLGPNSLSNPRGVFEGGGKLAVTDSGNGRILIYNPAPTLNGASAVQVFGQPNFATNSTYPIPASNTLANPGGVWTDGSILIVADMGNSRVLIYNNIGGMPAMGGSATWVVGQSTMAGLASPNPPNSSSLFQPTSVFYDGTRLFISDSGNNRVLVYNQLPMGNGVPADEVIGQPFMNTSGINQGGLSAQSLASPGGIYVYNGALFVADNSNSRVLIYNNIDSLLTNDPPADAVVGQSSFTTNAGGLGNNVFSGAEYVSASNGQLFVEDHANRVLIYNNIPTGTANPPANHVIGQPGFFTNQPNNGGTAQQNTLFTWNGSNQIQAVNGSLFVADDSNNRVLEFNCGSTTTATPTSTITNTVTVSPSGTMTFTSTNTSIATNTASMTSTATATMTSTATATQTPTTTSTMTPNPNNCANYPDWSGNGVSYTVGQKVVYGTEIYICIQAHNSLPNWEPPVTATLWSDVGPCVGATSTPVLLNCANIPQWAIGVAYTVGTEVVYNGELYQCIQGHTSITGWDPPAVPALWKDLGPCGSAATSTATTTPVNSSTPTVTTTPSSTLTDTQVMTATLTPMLTATSIMTNTVTQTPTDTSLNTSTSTATNTSTDTATDSSTSTATDTATSTATNTLSNTVTDTPTNTSLNTATLTSTNTSTNTATNTATSTVSNTATSTATNTLTDTATDSSTSTTTDTATSTATNTSSNTATNTPTDTSVNTFTSTATNTATDTATNTTTSTVSNTATLTTTNTSTNTATDTSTSTATDTATLTVTNTSSNTVTDTPTNTPINTSTSTATNTSTTTNSTTNTVTNTPTNTALNTTTSSATNTSTATATMTCTSTVTNTQTNTPTNTSLNTATATVTNTQTNTATSTATNSPTSTSTSTNTPLNTATQTVTNSPTNTLTSTTTPTETTTPTQTNSQTPTVTNTATCQETSIYISDSSSDVVLYQGTGTPTPTGWYNPGFATSGWANAVQVTPPVASIYGYPGAYYDSYNSSATSTGKDSLLALANFNVPLCASSVVINVSGKGSGARLVQPTVSVWLNGVEESNSGNTFSAEMYGATELQLGANNDLAIQVSWPGNTNPTNPVLEYTYTVVIQYCPNCTGLTPSMAMARAAAIRSNTSVTNASSLVKPSSTPTASSTPTVTATPTVAGLLQTAAAWPNISRNGEPIDFMVQLGSPATVKLSLYDLMGQQVYSKTIEGQTGMNTIPWSIRNTVGARVASGLYVFAIQVNDGSESRIKTGKVAIFH